MSGVIDVVWCSKEQRLIQKRKRVNRWIFLPWWENSLATDYFCKQCHKVTDSKNNISIIKIILRTVSKCTHFMSNMYVLLYIWNISQDYICSDQYIFIYCTLFTIISFSTWPSPSVSHSEVKIISTQLSTVKSSTTWLAGSHWWHTWNKENLSYLYGGTYSSNLLQKHCTLRDNI